MKTPITYYGGKQTLAKKIVEMIPSSSQIRKPKFLTEKTGFSSQKHHTEISTKSAN